MCRVFGGWCQLGLARSSFSHSLLSSRFTLVYLASSSLSGTREHPLDLTEGKCFLFNLAHFSVDSSFLLSAFILLSHLVSTYPSTPTLSKTCVCCHDSPVIEHSFIFLSFLVFSLNIASFTAKDNSVEMNPHCLMFGY